MGRRRDPEDVLALEVPLRRDAVVQAEQVGVPVAQVAEYLGRRPEEELSLHPLAVGVLRREEPSPLVPHLALQVVQRLLHHPPVERPAGELVRLQVQVGRQRVVVQHLLEVRHHPPVVGGVPVEPAPQVVIDAAGGHGLHSVLGYPQRVGVAGAPVVAEQELQRHGLRELGGRAKAALLRVVAGSQVGVRLLQQLRGEPLPRPLAQRCRLDAARQVVGRLQHLYAAVVVRVGHGPEKPGKPGHGCPVLRGKVGAAVEGLALRRQEGGQRPASPAGQRLHRLHVDAVQVRPFLPVDLDADEVLVHLPGDGLVFKRLPLHHVAPVAGRIADGEKDGLSLRLCTVQGLLAPRVPVHRVVRVLEQVRRRFVDEPVGHAYSLHHGRQAHGGHGLARLPRRPSAGTGEPPPCP